MMFGGRVAEEIVFGADYVTTGAADDIRQATDLARRMVTEWGMSDKLGPLRYNENEEEVFLGHSVTQRKNVSDATAEAIDLEIRQLIEDAQSSARKILTDHLDDLHALANGLLEYETLSGKDVEALLRGEPIHREDESTAPPPRDQGTPASVPETGGKAGAPGDLTPEPQPGS